MATLAYAIRTQQREKSTPGTSETTEQPGSSAWIDALAALVPAEVLAAHAFIITVTTKTTEGDDGEDMTAITDPTALKIAFWGLLGVAAVLYLLKKMGSLDPWDALRALLAPAAFFLWTMLTPSSAFDAVFPDFASGIRIVVAVLGAVVIAAAAKALASVADQKVT